jgi:polyhydroxyalkanoate synthesis repressor PhaR
MSDERVIKKYANRRLYDTTEKKYITLEDVRRLVQGRVPFHIVDAKSGDDITRNVLLQIISDQEDQGNPIFTTELLEQIIRSYGDAFQGFMTAYLQKSLDLFMEQQKAFRQQMESLMEQAPVNVMSDLAERNMALWKSMQEGFFSAYTARQNEQDKKKG